MEDEGGSREKRGFLTLPPKKGGKTPKQVGQNVHLH